MPVMSGAVCSAISTSRAISSASRTHSARFRRPSSRHLAVVKDLTGARAQAAGVSPELDARTPAERHRAMSWAQRLKRVFGIEIETCEQCGGKVRVIASIEDPAVIAKILGHVATRAPPPGTAAG